MGVIVIPALLIPIGVFAADPSIDFGSQAIVGRGDFLRTTIRAFDIDISDSGEYEIPFARVPKSMQPFVHIANERNAIGALGDDLRLAAPITRGQALRIVVELLNARSGEAVSFRDVRRGTMEEKAVRVAIARGWMEPLRENYFGLTRKLSGQDASRFLKEVLGSPGTQVPTQSSPKAPPTVQVQLRSTDSQASHIPHAKLLDTIWKIIRSDYLYEENVDETEAMYAGIESIVKSLEDPYSRFMRPKGTANFQTQISGKVSGIGAQVEDRNGILTIVTPIEGSPAQKAGLRPNDQIIAVDEKSLEGMDFLDAVNEVRGPKGSKAVLTIVRDGTTIKVTVMRDTVTVPEIAISWQGNIAVVKLMQFGKVTDEQLRDHMIDIQLQNPTGIILDVRNNPGGLLHAASSVLSNFLPQGSDVAIIKSREKSGNSVTQEAPTIKASVPLIVLVK